MGEHRMKAGVFAAGVMLSGVLVASGCKPSKEELDRMIDERLAARGIAPAAAESASALPAAKAAPTPDPPKNGPFEDSLAFLARLDELMKDYHPLPATDDGSDVFRCVTTDALASNKDLASARASRKQDAEAAKKERERREREAALTAYRLDYDWKTRRTPAQAATFGCYSKSFGEWADMEKSLCEMGGGKDTVWRERAPAHPAMFVYSGTEAEPTAPPELMRRIAAHRVTVPARFSCRVADVTSTKAHRTIQCAGGSRPSIRLSGSPPAINAGDEISVPLADTHRDPDGVLFRVTERAEARWTVDADAAFVKIDAAAKCPSVEEILASGRAKK